MRSGHDVEQRRTGAREDALKEVLAGAPVTERRLQLAGISTPVLEGGHGRPLVLLHNAGEFAAGWVEVLPGLATTNRVVVPDLPGHGASEVGGGPLHAGRVIEWLGELIAATCTEPPVLVGRVVGGAVAARFAIEHGDQIAGLVLVDTFGLTPFAPAPEFGLALNNFLEGPTDASYERLMEVCSFDLGHLRDRLGERWAPFAAYAVDRASTPEVMAAVGVLVGEFGMTAIPPEELATIAVPSSLIWGRHDLATPLAVAETASSRFGWPLHVIEDAADDPALDQPDAFLRALHVACEHVGA